MTISWKAQIWKLGLGLVVATSGIIVASTSNLLAQTTTPTPTPTLPLTKKLQPERLICNQYFTFIQVKVNNSNYWAGSVWPNLSTTIGTAGSIKLDTTIKIQVGGLGTHKFEPTISNGTYSKGYRNTCTLYYRVFESR